MWPVTIAHGVRGRVIRGSTFSRQSCVIGRKSFREEADAGTTLIARNRRHPMKQTFSAHVIGGMQVVWRHRLLIAAKARKLKVSSKQQENNKQFATACMEMEAIANCSETSGSAQQPVHPGQLSDRRSCARLLLVRREGF